MNKIKKTLFSLTAGAGLIAPLALSAGCAPQEGGNDDPFTPPITGGYHVLANDFLKNGRFDTETDKVKVGVTFAQGKDKWNALEGVIAKYNSLATAKKARLEELKAKAEKTEEEEKEIVELTQFVNVYQPVEITSLGSGGYDAGADYIRNNIKSKNQSQMISLIFNYPTVASYLASEGMLLNLSTEEDGMLNVKLDVFTDSFTKSNANTSNIVNNGTWVIPAAVSTNVLGTNAPVLSYILETMEANGATITISDYAAIKEAGKTDRQTVRTKWGDPIAAEEIKAILGEGYTVTDETLRVGKDLLDFSIKAKKIFAKAKDRKSPVHVLGVDDAAGFIQTLAYSAVDAKDRDFFVSKQYIKDNGVLNSKANYDGIKGINSKIGRKMTEITEKIREAIGVGALVIQGNGQYTSSEEILHNYAFGIGSTSGYNYNFSAGQTKKVYVVKDGDNEYYAAKTIANLYKKDDKSIRFETKDDRLMNGLYKTTNVDSAINDSNEKYSYFSLDTTTDANLDAAAEKIQATEQATEGNKNEYPMVIILNANNTKAIEKLKEIATNASDKMFHIGTLYNSRTQGADGAKFEAFLQLDKNLGDTYSSVASLETKGSESILNENELFALSAPKKWTKEDSKEVVYIQGPSIIGVHTNSETDDATRLFMKWFLSNQEETFTIGGEELTGTPSQVFGKAASYIVPVKGFETAAGEQKNKYLQRQLDDFIALSNGASTSTTYSEIADSRSNDFWNALKNVYISLSQDIYNSANGTVQGNYKTLIVDKIVSLAQTIFK
ncbi:P68 family surface lipoprotein [Mycoplasmopsis iners]|uniref:P68 family surface lipoprotein n=1 Tax=Mycoplasmopsis iners TaxID=76630 RepID=UPI000496F3FF|nr:P80 family lipoprotein [Mycoplasmopsis iners]